MVLKGPKGQVPICSRMPGASHTVPGLCRETGYSRGELCPWHAAACPGWWRALGGATKDQSQLSQEDFSSTFTDWYCSNIINIYFGGFPKSLEEKMVTISRRLIFQLYSWGRKKLIWHLVLAKVLFSIDQISVQRKFSLLIFIISCLSLLVFVWKVFSMNNVSKSCFSKGETLMSKIVHEASENEKWEKFY